MSQRATRRDMTIYCSQCRAPLRGMIDTRWMPSGAKGSPQIACKDVDACNARREAMLNGKANDPYTIRHV